MYIFSSAETYLDFVVVLFMFFFFLVSVFVLLVVYSTITAELQCCEHSLFGLTQTLSVTTTGGGDRARLASEGKRCLEFSH